MKQATGNESRRTIGGTLGVAAAALLIAASIIQPEAANADDGGGFHHRFGHFHGGFGIGAIYAPFWWVTAIPTPTITATIQSIKISATIPALATTVTIAATIPAPAITATIPATARSPGPGRPGTIVPTQPGIIRM